MEIYVKKISPVYLGPGAREFDASPLAARLSPANSCSFSATLKVSWYLRPTDVATKISKLASGWQILCRRLGPSRIKQRFGGFERAMRIRKWHRLHKKSMMR